MLQGVTSHPFPYPPPGDAFGCRCKLLFGKGSEEPHPQKPHIPNAKFLVIAPAPGSSKQFIGNRFFDGCTSLSSFDTSGLTSVTTIGYAFTRAASIRSAEYI